MTTFIHTMRAMYGLWAREAIVYKREYSRLISSLFSPIIWLVIVGAGFARIVDEEALHGADYQDWMLGGVIAMTVLFMTVFYGLYIVWDRKMDVLKAVLVAPVPRPALFVGKVLGGATQGVIEAVLVLLLAWPLFQYEASAIPGVIFFTLLLAIALTALGLALGSFFESFEGFQIVSTFVVFPMFFLSGALYPMEDQPGWLLAFMKFNPMSYAVDAFRGLLLGPAFLVYGFIMDAAVLAAFALVLMLVGAWSFNRMKQ
jgi:ABC-2 type transport system permease protein